MKFFCEALVQSPTNREKSTQIWVLNSQYFSILSILSVVLLGGFQDPHCPHLGTFRESYQYARSHATGKWWSWELNQDRLSCILTCIPCSSSGGAWARFYSYHSGLVFHKTETGRPLLFIWESFCSHREYLAVFGDILGCHNEGRAHWHLVVGGQGCSASNSAQDGPHNRLCGSKVSSAEVEKHCVRQHIYLSEFIPGFAPSPGLSLPSRDESSGILVLFFPTLPGSCGSLAALPWPGVWYPTAWYLVSSADRRHHLSQRVRRPLKAKL